MLISRLAKGPVLIEALGRAESTRRAVIKSTDRSIREKYEQYLTPRETAEFAARMFSYKGSQRVKCLDMGSGTGILSIALAERYDFNVEIDAIELDSTMAEICDKELGAMGIRHKVVCADALSLEYKAQYDCAILNPPYKKMAANDPRQATFPFKEANLYSAFVTRAIEALKPGGECVAIIPRSWANGDYFAAFRSWIFSHASIDWMHIYESRTEVFSDTDVLQETMLVKFSKAKQASNIKVTESASRNAKVSHAEYPSDRLIYGLAKKEVVRIRPVEDPMVQGLSTLKERGLIASTGKIVDFRSRDKTVSEPGEDCVPLIYSCNFSKNGFSHPVDAGKMQWYHCIEDKDRNLLVGPGSFVIVKRFSSKEETKRIKAFAFDAKEPVALENHQNFIHAGRPRHTVPLDDELAKGLSIWLNSSVVDIWFRSVSGSTQVNASDLNQMPIPPLGTLRTMSREWSPALEQSQIDSICEEALIG